MSRVGRDRLLALRELHRARLAIDRLAVGDEVHRHRLAVGDRGQLGCPLPVALSKVHNHVYLTQASDITAQSRWRPCAGDRP